MSGLPTRLVTAVTIGVEAGSGKTSGGVGAGQQVRISPVLQVAATPARWLESEWNEYRDAVLQVRGDFTRIAQGPRFDTSGDRRAESGAYTIAAAVTRELAGDGGVVQAGQQRIMVVGAAGWFTDSVAQQQAEVDGRVVALLPGNLQLLESSVLWLAGQEDQLARGAVSVSTPTIPALSGGQVATIRWVLGLGVPLLVLLAGLAYRQLRR